MLKQMNTDYGALNNIFLLITNSLSKINGNPNFKCALALTSVYSTDLHFIKHSDVVVNSDNRKFFYK